MEALGGRRLVLGEQIAQLKPVEIRPFKSADLLTTSTSLMIARWSSIVARSSSRSCFRVAADLRNVQPERSADEVLSQGHMIERSSAKPIACSGVGSSSRKCATRSSSDRLMARAKPTPLAVG